MSNDSGIFSLSIQSAQWQLKHLFDEVGGDDAIRALDSLSSLPPGVQKNLLLGFERIIMEVKTGALKLQPEEQPKVSDFEQSLLTGISQEIQKSRFTVIDGGKTKSKSSKIVDFPVRVLAPKESEETLIA